MCLVQDDDVIPTIPPGSKPPSTTSPPIPARAIIGGFIGFQSFDPDPAVAVPFWGRSEFRYVHRVNIGPYFVRRTSYQQLVGGWDHNFSGPGDPGICYESELCRCAWITGYPGGLQLRAAQRRSGALRMDGGTMLFAPHERERNRVAHSRRIFELYASRTADIDALVEHANIQRQQPYAPRTCWTRRP